MNAERLHAVILDIKKDMEATGLPGLLQTLATNLQNQLQQPQQANVAAKLGNTLNSLQGKLRESKVNEFTPAWRQTVDDLGVADLLGSALADQLRGIFERNQITESVALGEVSALKDRVEKLKTWVDSLASGFGGLKVGLDELAPGECEVGVLIPRTFVSNQLREFSKELEEINKLMLPFVEIGTGSRPGVDIRFVSSSDLSVFLDVASPVCACFAVAVERAVALYKNILEIRRLRAEIRDAGVPESDLKDVDKHANKLIGNGTRKIAKEIIAEFYGSQDAGRQSELETEVRNSINKIVNRIDRGINIEIHVGPDVPEEKGEPEGDVGSSASEKERKALAKAREVSIRMQFLEVKGEAILSLPEGPSGKDDTVGPSE